MKVFPARRYPDLSSVEYALNLARGTNNMEATKHLELLKARSQAFAMSYGTHIPLLASVLATAMPGDVLELGAGHSSSPVLSEMCRASGRHLITLERPGAWADVIDDLLGDHHERRLVVDTFQWLPDIKELFEEHGGFAVVFVDHGLDRTDGGEVLNFLRGVGAQIVVHDTCNTWFAGIDDVLDTYTYRFDYEKMAPCTSVVSMTQRYPGGDR